MMTPPFNISAKPRFTSGLPVDRDWFETDWSVMDRSLLITAEYETLGGSIHAELVGARWDKRDPGRARFEHDHLPGFRAELVATRRVGP